MISKSILKGDFLLSETLISHYVIMKDPLFNTSMFLSKMDYIHQLPTQKYSSLIHVVSETTTFLYG